MAACVCGGRLRLFEQALTAGHRSPVGALVELRQAKKVGVRQMAVLLRMAPVGRQGLLVVSQSGFTEGARALASQDVGVRLYVRLSPAD